MHSIDEQPVTEGKPEPQPKRFEVHISNRLSPFVVECHDFREVGRYLQFDDKDGNPVAVFPSDELVAALRVPSSPADAPAKTERLDVTMSNGVEIRDLGLRVRP